MNNKFKTARIVAAYTKVEVGNPQFNAQEILKAIKKTPTADVILFPELSITGYTCGDLFNQTALLESAWSVTESLAEQIESQVVVVGLPFVKNDALYNCAAVLNSGHIVGLVPKTYLPNYKEFYESRWFCSAPNEFDADAFGTDLIFDNGCGLKIGIEICEDFWSIIPPSSYQAIAGANLLLNLSASNELVAKSEYRRSLVESQSGRCIAAYAYCSSGPTESTTDLLFGGHCIIAENGSILSETERFKESDFIEVDIDLEKLGNERRRTTTFHDTQQRINTKFRNIPVVTGRTGTFDVKLKANKFPFVPNDPNTLQKRCEEIFNIQVNALAKRMNTVNSDKYVIGVSGGLDSTLALMVAVKACDKLGKSRKCIDAVTMPGFGTSNRTLDNANKLMDLLGVSKTTIDIQQQCLDTFRAIGHQPFGIPLEIGTLPSDLEWIQEKLEQLPEGAKDVVFENVQARIRTLLLMSRGFVLGTGDMSEMAIGWCTYNADHMSMYNVNCGVPKTLIKFLVEYLADCANKEAPLGDVLLSIANTEISPELLPLGKDGEIVHSTEDIVGPYSVLDFFLFHLVRNGFAPNKILFLAQNTFDEHSPKQLKIWLKDFIKRFFRNQFKRSCVPDGPKVGSVSLSPRGDWRMPSDADPTIWLDTLCETL